MLLFGVPDMPEGAAVATVITARGQLGHGSVRAAVRGESPEEWTSGALLGWNKPRRDRPEGWPRERGGTADVAVLLGVGIPGYV